MDRELAKECLQVVSAIRCEIISRSISCNLGAILDLLRQALRLAEAGQATGETLAESGEFEARQCPLPVVAFLLTVHQGCHWQMRAWTLQAVPLALLVQWDSLRQT